MIGRLERPAKIVHGEDVFKEFRFLKVANAAGLARWIQLVCDVLGAGVKVVVVARLVDANAPQNDGGTVPVAPNHAADIVHGNVLPRLVAAMLPAGNLFEYEQADLVAGVEKVARLRVM